VAYLEKKKLGNESSKMLPVDFTHGPTTIVLPYVVDIWGGNHAKKHVSVQIQLLSGDTNNVNARVSSDKKSLVCTFKMTPYLWDSSRSVVSVGLQRERQMRNITDDDDEFTSKLNFEFHGKPVARQTSIASIKNRNPSNDITYEQRIPLPFRCMHKPATFEEDKYFFGIQTVHFHDGSYHLNVELVADSGDNYMADAAAKLATMKINEKNINGGIPPYVNTYNNNGMDVESIHTQAYHSPTVGEQSIASARTAFGTRSNKRLALEAGYKDK
jgi:hypothetical protein